MKPQKLQKSLGLKKQTIANLENRNLSKVKGGACTYPVTGCDSINKVCCSVNPGTCTMDPYCLTDNQIGCPGYTLCADPSGCPTTGL